MAFYLSSKELGSWRTLPKILVNLDLQGIAHFTRAVAIGVLASSIAIAYSEVLFIGTRWLYMRGKLQRYYPLPTARGATSAWINTMSFTVPTALYATYMQPNLERSFSFNPIYLVFYVALYMLIHDTYFYWAHRTFHVIKPLYAHLHARHHEYSYSMHVYIVGHADLIENAIQVGVPWLIWTAIAGHNWFYWLSPLSFVVYSTLIGHSGYRSNKWLMIFHPFALPIALFSGRMMLTTGDHQMHHSHRRVNFGLFFRFWDMRCGSYKKCSTRAEPRDFWAKWSHAIKDLDGDDDDEHARQARKWLGRNQVAFHEIEWGF